MSTNTTSLSRPPKVHHNFRRVAILFAGGPAPAANAVISTAAVSFLRNDIEVIGILYGYSNLVQYGPDHPMQEGRDYVMLDHARLKRTRNSQGIMIGSARTNPGKEVTCKADLDDPAKTAPLKTVYDALCSLGVDALVSIGGDDTLKTANKFQMFQDRMPAGSQEDSRSCTCRRPSTTTTWGSTSRLGISRRSRRWRAKSATCWPMPSRRGATSWRRRWAAAPVGSPTGPPSPAKPVW